MIVNKLYYFIFFLVKGKVFSIIPNRIYYSIVFLPCMLPSFPGIHIDQCIVLFRDGIFSKTKLILITKIIVRYHLCVTYFSIVFV